MEKKIMIDNLFIKDKKNIYYFKLNLQDAGFKKIDDIINYIDSLKICDYIVKLDKYNTYEV